MSHILFNEYQIADITQNKWIENCKADICIWPDVVEEQDKVLDSVRNNMVDECTRNRNPNEVTVEVSKNLTKNARTGSNLICPFFYPGPGSLVVQIQPGSTSCVL